jgi:hypothetical protein
MTLPHGQLGRVVSVLDRHGILGPAVDLHVADLSPAREDERIAGGRHDQALIDVVAWRAVPGKVENVLRRVHQQRVDLPLGHLPAHVGEPLAVLVHRERQPLLGR